jgi:hypothetical protein
LLKYQYPNHRPYSILKSFFEVGREEIEFFFFFYCNNRKLFSQSLEAGNLRSKPGGFPRLAGGRPLARSSHGLSSVCRITLDVQAMLHLLGSAVWRSLF